MLAWSIVHKETTMGYYGGGYTCNDQDRVELRTLKACVFHDDFFDSATTVLTFKAPKGATRRQVNESAREMYDTFCTHSYDCCGRFYGSVMTHMTRRTKRREWKVVVASSRNI